MSTLTLPAVVISGILIGLTLVFAIPALRAYFTYRGNTAGNLSRKQARCSRPRFSDDSAATAFLGTNALRLDRCTRWPDHKNCGQECLNELRSIPPNVWFGIS